MEQPASTSSGLTPAEQAVADALVAAWNALLAVPGLHPEDLTEFRQALHVQQNILAGRVAARLFPHYWR